MQDVRKKLPGITVRVVGSTGIAAPLVRILVDDVAVGILKDKQTHTFSINPGRHRIKARRDFFRSQVLEFDLSARQGADLECGFNRVRPWYRSAAGRAGLIAGCIASAFAVAALKLPYWSVYVVVGLAVVAMTIGWWRSYIPAGTYLYLRRVTDSNGRTGRS